MKNKTIIIGAGISGLSAAHFLQQKKEDFLVLEAAPTVGGNIRSQLVAGFVCENGPNTVLMNNPATEELIAELGLSQEVCRPAQSAAQSRFVLYQDKLQQIPTTPWSFVRSPLLNWKEKLAVLQDFYTAKHTADSSVAAFCKKRFGNAFYQQFIVPFVTGIYAGNPEKMSVKFALKSLWGLEQEYGSVIKGLIQKQKERKGLPAQTIFSFPKGLGQLCNAIGQGLGTRLHTHTEVQKIENIDQGYKLHTSKGVFECKQLICTLAGPQLAALIEAGELSTKLKSIEYVPVDVYHFGFDKKQVKNQIPGFGILTKATDNKHFLGALFNSRFFAHTAPQGKELFTLIVGGSRQAQLCEEDPKKVAPILLDELKELLSIEGEPCMEKHLRWGKAIPQYDLQHQQLLDALQQHASLHPAFYILGNYAHGISVSDRVLRAQELINNL